MKDITPNPDKDKIEIVQSKEEEIAYEQKFIGSLQPKRGHTLFEINTKTLEINKAEFEKADLDLTKVFKGEEKIGRLSKKIVVKDDCVYISALNKKNALKKYKK